MNKEIEYLLVINTCPDSVTANKIATRLVENKLAACVQVLPGVQSFFHWSDKVDNAEEHLLLIKTTQTRYAELEKDIREIHPYELPEIIAVPITTGSTDYLSWLKKSTQK